MQIDGIEAVRVHIVIPEKTLFKEDQKEPPAPLERSRITQPIATGIRAIDSLLTCGKGQRNGIFAGSGCGKSTLMGLIAWHSNADLNVIALICERGREDRDFIE